MIILGFHHSFFLSNMIDQNLKRMATLRKPSVIWYFIFFIKNSKINAMQYFSELFYDVCLVTFFIWGLQDLARDKRMRQRWLGRHGFRGCRCV